MADNNKINEYRTKSSKRVFHDDQPYAHMYVKDDDGKLVRLVETQPLSYLNSIITNIDQTKEAVTILTDLTEILLEDAREAFESGSKEDRVTINTNIATVLEYKGEISKLTKTAPVDIDGIKLLIDRILQDSQAEARALTGDRPKSFREDSVDIVDDGRPEIIAMEGNA